MNSSQNDGVLKAMRINSLSNRKGNLHNDSAKLARVIQILKKNKI